MKERDLNVFINGQWIKTDGSRLESVDPVNDLHYMPTKCAPDPKTGTEFARGPVLRPTGNSEGQSQRYGRLDLVRRPPPDVEWKDVQNHEWSNYEEFDGTDKYTITII